MKIFNRIRTAWRLSRDPDIQEADTVLFSKNGQLFPFTPPVEGDSKAEFLGEGTTDEFEDMEKEDKGLKGVFGL